MECYERKYLLRSEHVDMRRKLRTSTLFGFLEEASIAHTEALGMGRDKTLDKGYLWVILQQSLTFYRTPSYDETILIRSWPGEMMHVLFPRYYEVLDEEGNVLIEGSALWALIDVNSRKLVFPERAGVHIDGMEADKEIPLPETIRRMETDRSSSLNVPYSLCDLNGHLNNTRYFDLFEDVFFKDGETADYVSLSAEYLSEVRFGSELTLSYLRKDGLLYMEGNTGGKAAFRILAKEKE